MFKKCQYMELLKVNEKNCAVCTKNKNDIDTNLFELYNKNAKKSKENGGYDK